MNYSFKIYDFIFDLNMFVCICQYVRAIVVAHLRYSENRKCDIRLFNLQLFNVDINAQLSLSTWDICVDAVTPQYT